MRMNARSSRLFTGFPNCRGSPFGLSPICFGLCFANPAHKRVPSFIVLLLEDLQRFSTAYQLNLLPDIHRRPLFCL